MTIALNNTDVIEGGASVASVVDFTISGIVGTTITRLASGTLTTTLTTALYTAGAAVGVSSIVLVNTHSAAVNVTLRLDPADGAVPRYLIPETISLGIGYSLHTNGTSFAVFDASGNLMTLPGNHVHDGDTLQLDGVNSNGGAFAFTTSGAVTFGQDIITTEDVKIGDGKYIGSASDPDAIQITASGEVIMNAQPAFLVKPTSSQLNIAVGSNVTVIFGTEIFDVGGNFASNTFTAPVPGKYQMDLALSAKDFDTAATSYVIYFVASNRSIGYYLTPGGFAADYTENRQLSILIDMDAFDTLYVTIKQAGGGQQSDIEAAYTQFSGFLAC